MKTITIILGILLLASVSAYSSGETIELAFSDTVKDCYIINNQTSLEGINLIENDSNVFIETLVSNEADSFTVSCLVNSYREESSSGGGSSDNSKIRVWGRVIRPPSYSSDVPFRELDPNWGREGKKTEVIIPIDITPKKQIWIVRFFKWLWDKIIFWR